MHAFIHKHIRTKTCIHTLHTYTRTHARKGTHTRTFQHLCSCQVSVSVLVVEELVHLFTFNSMWQTHNSEGVSNHGHSIQAALVHRFVVREITQINYRATAWNDNSSHVKWRSSWSGLAVCYLQQGQTSSLKLNPTFEPLNSMCRLTHQVTLFFENLIDAQLVKKCIIFVKPECTLYHIYISSALYFIQNQFNPRPTLLKFTS